MLRFLLDTLGVQGTQRWPRAVSGDGNSEAFRQTQHERVDDAEHEGWEQEVVEPTPDKGAGVHGEACCICSSCITVRGFEFNRAGNDGLTHTRIIEICSVLSSGWQHAVSFAYSSGQTRAPGGM